MGIRNTSGESFRVSTEPGQSQWAHEIGSRSLTAAAVVLRGSGHEVKRLMTADLIPAATSEGCGVPMDLDRAALLDLAGQAQTWLKATVHPLSSSPGLLASTSSRAAAVRSVGMSMTSTAAPTR